MILTIVFFLVLLIGVSLFIAVVGTAFLRKHVRHARKSVRYAHGGGELLHAVPPSPPERAAAQRAMHEQRQAAAAQSERVFQAERPSGMGRSVPGFIPAQPRAMPVERPAYAGGESRWFLISILALIFIVFSVFFGIKAYQNITSRPRLYFSENVDFLRMKPIKRSDVFTRGNVALLFRSGTPLDTDRVRIDIYKIDLEGVKSFASKVLPVKPDWTSFSVKVLFDQTGTYTVMVYTGKGTLLVQDNVTIVPDSFAYKPVPVK